MGNAILQVSRKPGFGETHCFVYSKLNLASVHLDFFVLVKYCDMFRKKNVKFGHRSFILTGFTEMLHS